MGRKYIKNKTSIHIGIILLVTSVIIFTLAATMYFKLSKPEFYKTFIALGNKFLNESKYEEAILEFEKAIHIEPKSTEARIGNGKGYIGTNEVDNAVEEFKEAQSIDIENTRLLLEILEILKDIDSEIAYDILQNYINKTQNTIPNTIQEIINNSNDKPEIPIINPVPGTYINPISVKLEQEKLIVGHTFYYTLDGSEPSKESIKYSGGIEIKEDTIIKLIAYNPKDEPSEVIILEYFINTEMLNKLEELIKECEELNKNTEEGTKIGNCIKGSKEKFRNIIDSVKESLDKDAINLEDANEMYKKLSSALDEFKYNIIEKTDKNELKNAIEKAQNIHDKSVEGNKDGQYKAGSKKKLLSAIKEAQKMYNNILSKQKDVDDSIYLLNQAINVFNNSIVVSFNEQQAINILKQKVINELNSAKKIEYESQGYMIEFGMDTLENGMSHGKKYYKIMSYAKAYLPDGELFYSEMDGGYVEYTSFGNTYIVYEDGDVEEVGFNFN